MDKDVIETTAITEIVSKTNTWNQDNLNELILWGTCQQFFLWWLIMISWLKEIGKAIEIIWEYSNIFAIKELKKTKMINYRLWWEIMTVLIIQYLADIYLFKVKYGNTKTMCENCSKLPIKTPSERHHTIDFTHWKFIIFVSDGDLLLLLTETFGLLKFSCRTQ